MIKKILFTFSIFFLTIFTVFSAEINSNTQNYEPHLQKGTLIKVYSKIPLSTKSLEEGSKVYFIVPQDIWILEKKAISKGDIFYGYVSKLNMPVVGVNAAMKIAITTLIKTTGERIKLDGKIIFPGGGEVLGGTLTNPASYNKMIHPRRVYGAYWGGTIQYVPSGEYEHGDHVGITTKDSLCVQLDEDYYLSY